MGVQGARVGISCRLRPGEVAVLGPAHTQDWSAKSGAHAVQGAMAGAACEGRATAGGPLAEVAPAGAADPSRYQQEPALTFHPALR